VAQGNRDGGRWTHLGLELTIHKLDCNGTLATASGTHHNEVVCDRPRLYVLVGTIAAKVPSFRVFKLALGASV
jgi:hypothetical protein